MSAVTVEDVYRVAALARIGVTADEAERLAVELASVIGFVEQLQAVNIDGVPPTDQVTGLTNVTRPDVVVPASQTQAELLMNAPSTQDGSIKVKRVNHG
jgi:aspartyl-tRNA(Asn)/glutamyl-tRNA(Gln) amidotransferase subunit C